MTRKDSAERLKQILELEPAIRQLLTSSQDLEQKRQAIRSYLSELLLRYYDQEEQSQPLEWIICRDAIWVLRNVLSRRSEELAGFSLLQYLCDLLDKPDNRSIPKARPGFFMELEKLFKGITGEAGVYKEKPPAFLKYTGRKAARMRSADLSRMAAETQRFINRYPSGLDDHLVSRASTNRQAIMQYFGITDLEWNDWHWHTRHIIRDADTMRRLVKLTDEEYQAILGARENRIPFGITPYYLSLMNFENPGEEDQTVRAQVIPPLEYVTTMCEHRDNSECSMDFMIESDTSPIEGITRRYPNIVILKPILTCPQICVYCQRNWQIEDVYSEHAAMGQGKLDKALDWIEETPEINEVLVTGGDPLLLTDDKLEAILSRLAAMDQIVRIRIGTRTPVTLPQRVTDSLARIISRFHVPGQREVMIITHFEHTTEITPEAMNAVQKFRRFGISVYNQLVYTFYNSRKFEASALRQKLRLIGVTPYYTFNTKGKQETDRYRVPIARLLQEQQEEARLLPGTVRTDEIVFNVPKLGKNYLLASQNRDIISLTPEGRRVYEFHPWEKKLALVNTYVYTDVPIFDYLQKLRQAGEQVKDYETIWYYY